MFDNLSELKQACEACTDCNLSERRTQVVFGDGDPQSRLVLIGEGPGDHEDRTGQPFVGRAGKMLDKALKDAGLDRSQIYICNTVKCRAADWSSGKPQNRPPEVSEVQSCRRWLVPQLQMISPRVILCIGAPSAKNLISKKFQITKQRGVVYQSELGYQAIATLHPSYILRMQRANDDGGYGLFVSDLKLAWETAHGILGETSVATR